MSRQRSVSMDEFFQQLNQFPDDLTGLQSMVQALVAIVLSFVLSLLIVYTYRATHIGTSYSQAFAQTLTLMCVVTAVIMLIIGSNIARAFSLVGALSIIRFRSAVKDPRDVGFIFLAMAVGMAVGTRFYLVAITFAITVCGISFLLKFFDVGSKKTSEALLHLVVKTDTDHEQLLKEPFFVHLRSQSLLTIESVDDRTQELVYSIQPKSKMTESAFVDELSKMPGIEHVRFIPGLQNINV